MGAILSAALVLTGAATYDNHDPAQSGHQSNQAIFTLTVPADAQVTVDGAPTRGSSETRVLKTGPLVRGQNYFYDVLVHVNRDGQDYYQKERIFFTAGEQIRRSFLSILNDIEAKSYPRKSQIPAELRVNDMRRKTELQAFLQVEPSRRGLSDTTPADAARYQDRDTILTAVAAMEPIDLDPDAINDVTYHRMGADRLKVVLDVRRSASDQRLVRGRITLRDSDRFYCIYRKFKGDWMLESYWSSRGDTLGDYLIRWENNLKAAFAGEVVSNDEVVAPAS